MRRSSIVVGLGLACMLVAAGAHAASPSSRLVVNVPPSITVPPVNSRDAARQLLVVHAAIPPQVVLDPVRTLSLRGVTAYRFAQTHMGVPVYARGAGLAVDRQGKVILATARVETDLPASVSPSLGAADAASIATNLTGVPASEDDAHLMIVAIPGGARLAWMVQAPPLLPSLEAPLVTVDAQTGRVLGAVNATRFENQAKVYRTNPVVDNGTTSVVTLPVGASQSVPANDDIVSYNCVDNGTVKTVTTSHGTRDIHICDLLQAAPDSTSGDYTQYGPAPDDQGGDYFAELQIFYHANKAFDYFRGFDGNSGFKLADVDTPLFAVANWMTAPHTHGTPSADGGVGEGGTTPEAGVEAGDAGDAAADAGLAPLQPYQNAAYVPYQPGAGGSSSLTTLYPDKISGGVLEFGQGQYADYSYDGEVIYHEFTHAVVNATLNLVPYWHLDSQGGTPAPGAMNEGLADFFSASISGESKMGTYAIKDLQIPGLTMDCIRNLDNANASPKDQAGEVHTDSLFFSGALWKVRSQLASDDLKKQFTQAMFTTMITVQSGDLGYKDLADAFVTALKNTMGDTTAQAMTDEFKARGILPENDRTIEWAGQAIHGYDPQLSGVLILPGLMDYLTTLPYAPSYFQVKVPLGTGATTITATFESLSSGSSYYGGGGITPAYLASFDQAVAFHTLPSFGAVSGTVIDATTPQVDGGADTQTWTASIPVPPGSSAAYLMLVNKGNGEGYFTNLSFTADGEPVDGGIDAAPGQDSGGSSDAGVEPADGGATPDADTAGNNAAAPSDASGGGCGCRTAQSTGGAGAAGVLLAGLSWVASRRRRNSARP